MIVVFGLNHKTAPIQIQERISSCAQSIKNTLTQCTFLEEFMLIKTCNRFEIIYSCENAHDIVAYLANNCDLDSTELNTCSYQYQNEEACRHLMQVCSGIDSMVIGETEIFGQVKQAYKQALTEKTVGDDLTKIMPYIFMVAKQVRSSTDITTNHLSLAYTLLQLTKSVFTVEKSTILFIGAGEIITKILKIFQEDNLHKIYIANRTTEKAKLLATNAKATVIDLAEINNYIQSVDIIISGISSPLPIIGKGLIERAIEHKSPKLLIDLGMPRNMEPEISSVKNAYLYNLDNIHDILSKNIANRKAAAKNAAKIIDIEAKQCFSRFQTLNTIHIVKEFRSEIEIMRDMAKQQAIIDIQNGKCPEEVIHNTLQILTNKILHKPTIYIKKAIQNKRHDLIKLTKDFFTI